MDTPVVHDIRFYDLVAVRFQYLGKAVAQQDVAHVPQVERFVGVGRRVFDHHQRRLVGGGNDPVVRFSVDGVEQVNPLGASDGEIQESLDYIKLRYGRLVFQQVIADLPGGLLGGFLGDTQEWEDHQRQVSLEFFLGFLQLYLVGVHLRSVQRLDAGLDSLGNLLFDDHIV